MSQRNFPCAFTASVSGSVALLVSFIKNFAVVLFGSEVASTGFLSESAKFTTTLRFVSAPVPPFVRFIRASNPWRSKVNSWSISMRTATQTASAATPFTTA